MKGRDENGIDRSLRCLAYSRFSEIKTRSFTMCVVLKNMHLLQANEITKDGACHCHGEVIGMFLNFSFYCLEAPNIWLSLFN